MMPKCCKCGDTAQFGFEKKATKDNPIVAPAADWCYECYEAHVMPEVFGGFDPLEVRDMALKTLRKQRETH